MHFQQFDQLLNDELLTAGKHYKGKNNIWLRESATPCSDAKYAYVAAESLQTLTAPSDDLSVILVQAEVKAVSTNL